MRGIPKDFGYYFREEYRSFNWGHYGMFMGVTIPIAFGLGALVSLWFLLLLLLSFYPLPVLVFRTKDRCKPSDRMAVWTT